VTEIALVNQNSRQGIDGKRLLWVPHATTLLYPLPAIHLMQQESFAQDGHNGGSTGSSGLLERGRTFRITDGSPELHQICRRHAPPLATTGRRGY
jgi:hypothetical protein